jgi:hypothetical protein
MKRGFAVGVLVLGLMAACSAQSSAPPAPQQTQAVATVAEAVTAVASLEARFDPTAAVGGGSNASGAVTAEQLQSIFASVQQASQLRFTANSSPPGATGAAVTSVSIRADDAGGTLKSLDANGRKTLGDALLTAAGTAWPQARVTLLVTDPSSSTQIIGTRSPGGPNTVIGG